MLRLSLLVNNDSRHDHSSHSFFKSLFRVQQQPDSLSVMRFYQVDPTKDVRWAQLVDRHPRASVFHTVGWLQALRRTYGYEPVVFTTSSPTGDLENGLVFCRIKSWLTGRRLVSLPFSDHCDPLCESAEDVSFLMRYLQSTLEHQEWKYLEVRPVNGSFDETGHAIGFRPTAQYFLHRIDLHPELKEIFQSFDKDSVQRRIQRAQRGGLVEGRGRSEDLLHQFYDLFVLTRGRHHLPPIPIVWFRNLIETQKDSLEIRLAFQDKKAIAGILTLRFRDCAYYKYGCSDVRFNRFGAIPWLLWNAISDAKLSGAKEFDLGRTQDDNEGLLTFKGHWVPHPSRLIYWKYPDAPALDSANGWKLKAAKQMFSYMPEKILRMTGRLIYRHIG